MIGVVALGGVGFTMSLFINNLAFANTSYVAQAKVGILAAGLIAGTTGWLILRGGVTTPRPLPGHSKGLVVMQRWKTKPSGRSRDLHPDNSGADTRAEHRQLAATDDRHGM